MRSPQTRENVDENIEALLRLEPSDRSYYECVVRESELLPFNVAAAGLGTERLGIYSVQHDANRVGICAEAHQLIANRIRHRDDAAEACQKPLVERVIAKPFAFAMSRPSVSRRHGDHPLEALQEMGKQVGLVVMR